MLLIIYMFIVHMIYVHIVPCIALPITHECKIIILQILELLSVYTIFIQLWDPVFIIHRPTSTMKFREFIPVQTEHVNILCETHVIYKVFSVDVHVVPKTF